MYPLYFYADDNSMSHSSPTLQGVLSSLLNDYKITVDWFANNGMKANPAKNPVHGIVEEPDWWHWIAIGRDTILSPEKSVKALRVITGNHLTFSDHIEWEGPDMNDGFPYVWNRMIFNCALFYCLKSYSYPELFSISFMVLCTHVNCTVYILHQDVY